MSFQCTECTLTRSGTGPTCEECLGNMQEAGYHGTVWKAVVSGQVNAGQVKYVPGAYHRGFTQRIFVQAAWAALIEDFTAKYDREHPDKIAVDQSITVNLR